jgi:membrane-associated phospholipid phosphatase
MPTSQTPDAGPPAAPGRPAAGPARPHDPQRPPRAGLLARLEARDVAASAVIGTRWPHPRFVTVPLGAISLTGNYGVVWVVLAAIGAAAGTAGFSGRRFAYAAGAVLATEWITFLIKLVFRRRRPTQRDPAAAKADIPLPLSPSFPSSHASMSTVGALAMGVLYPSLWPAFAALAVVLAVSRVYLRVHFLADVLAGICLGLVIGLPYITLVRI